MEGSLSSFHEEMHLLEEIPCNVIDMSTFISIEPVLVTIV
jgi:hypothetical protein